MNQSKLGRDADLQNTHCYFQVTSRSASSWYIKCTKRSWINSHRLVSRCNICSFWSFIGWFIPANTGLQTLLHKRQKCSVKILCSEKLKQLEHLDDEHTKSLYSPSVPTFSTTCKIQFLKTCSEMVFDFRFLSECFVNLLQRHCKKQTEIMCWNPQLNFTHYLRN